VTAPTTTEAPSGTSGTPIDAAERQELRETVRDALGRLSPPDVVRRHAEQGWDRALWQRLCGELGLAGLAVSEELGGSGCSWQEQSVVVEEAGAALLVAPLLSTVALALPVLLESASEAALALVPALCSGERTATLLLGSGPDAAARLAAQVDGGTWTVSGALAPVVDGGTADDLVVAAEGPDGLVLLHVERGAAGVTTTPLVPLDLTRAQARVELAEAPATLLAGGPAAEQALERALQVSRALLASEAVGVAQRALDRTVAYAKERVQFGRPIGSFQAVKQKAADMLIKVESARSAAHAAAQAVSTGSPDPATAVAVAAAYCGEAAVAVTLDAIQLHGGIGFTWEHDAHLWFKRARTDRDLLGRPSSHVDRLAALLAAPAQSRTA